ncbi:MAG: hydratase [Bacillota bacterium]|jgi:aconitate hydratase|nr:hydratase [Bacillota bacterium]HHU43489.1 hydratase [Clostridiales bacterium]
MIKLSKKGVYFLNGKRVSPNKLSAEQTESAYKGTIAYSILSAHNTLEKTEKNSPLKLKFDAMASHDITYVGIIQTAKASGLKKFPIPYVLTNCHNSLCAVGGTINEDDHNFGYSAAKKYGGIYVPAHQGVIHSYMRERMAGCGKMILGSDSHTRYGALGTMAIGEGGGELVKQLLGKTYDIPYPGVVGVELKGRLRKGVGPQDVALTIIKAVFEKGYVKNKVMEFFGSGIKNLPIEYRNGIDVMTTETTCLSSIWQTDDKVKKYFFTHKREQDYKPLKAKDLVYYDGYIRVNLSKIEPMIALPFHPSNVYTIRELLENPYEILSKCEEEGNRLLKGKGQFKLTNKIVNGKIKVDQAIIAGCAGGLYDNIMEAVNIIRGKDIGNRLSMSVYPGSQPIYIDLARKGAIAELLKSGVNVKTAFCGPCFGAGDIPSHNGFSIRHTTRNFESREGSKPAEGQMAAVALMDSRSIAATAINGGYLTPATEIEYNNRIKPFSYDDSVYESRIYDGYGNPDDSVELQYGPNITDWPKMQGLKRHLLMKVAAVIDDPVTTTDELIPSGETSSYRSNPLRLAEFTLSRKRPDYVERAKQIQALELRARNGDFDEEYLSVIKAAAVDKNEVGTGSVIYANRPGDGSAREQAASCQRVLGGVANIAKEYATKRYRSNLINWGMIPFIYDNKKPLEVDDIIIIKDIKRIFDEYQIKANVFRKGKNFTITLKMDKMSQEEKQIIQKGSLINFYRSQEGE